jgi:hypothetical protein
MTLFKSALCLFLILLVAPFATDLLASPPGLPEAPSQAPIDGGLGLLAAGGAAYAWKKLRSKRDA